MCNTDKINSWLPLHLFSSNAFWKAVSHENLQNLYNQFISKFEIYPIWIRQIIHKIIARQNWYFRAFYCCFISSDRHIWYSVHKIQMHLNSDIWAQTWIRKDLGWTKLLTIWNFLSTQSDRIFSMVRIQSFGLFQVSVFSGIKYSNAYCG